MADETINVDGAADAIENLLSDDNPEATFEGDGAREEEETRGDVDDGPEESEDELTDEAEEAEDGAESEEETADEDAEEESEEAEGYASLEEVAEALEMPMEDFLENFELTFNAAGETHTATLNDLQKSYQKDADYTKKSMALADERKDFEANREKREQEYEANSKGMADMIQAVGQMIIQDMTSPEMQSLRQSDPAEWSAKDIEARRKLEYLEQVRKQGAQQYTEQNNTSQAEFLKEQGKILEEKVEGWGEEKLTTAVEAIRSLGFNDEEIPRIGDARLMMGALELHSLRAEVSELKALQEKGDLVKKKVKKLPKKPVKSGSSQPAKKNNIAKLKQKLKNTPKGRENTQAAANVIERLI